MNQLEKTDRQEMVTIRVRPKTTAIYRCEMWSVPNPPPQEGLPSPKDLNTLQRLLAPSPTRKVFIDYMQ